MPVVENTTETVPESKHSWGITTSAGALSGALAAFAAFPAEGLKKRKQSGQPINAQAFNPNNLFNGARGFMFSVALTTVLQETAARALKHDPANGPESTLMRASKEVVSGGLGAIASSVVESTILGQQLLTQQQGKTAGPLAPLRLLTQHSLRAPFAGFGPLFFREVGFAECYRHAKQAKEFVAKETESDALGWLALLGLGAVGSLVTQPFDTVATYIQHDLYKQLLAAKNAPIQKISPTEAIRRIASSKDGMKAFWEGGGWRIAVFTVCMGFISWTKDPIAGVLERTSTSFGDLIRAAASDETTTIARRPRS